MRSFDSNPSRKGDQHLAVGRKGHDEQMFNRKIKYLADAISVRIEDLSHSGLGKGPYDCFTNLSVYYGATSQDDSSERQTWPSGVYSPFVIGGSWHPQPQPLDEW